MIGPIKVHVDNKGIIDGLWRGERKCIDPKAGGADLCRKIGKNCTFQSQKKRKWKWSMQRRTPKKKDKKEMSHSGKFVTDGNEKAG